MFYGRRIAKVRKGRKIIYVMTGQWVGHLYGDQFGSQRQRQILLNNCGGSKILSLTKKVFWNLRGYSGEEVDKTFYKKFEYVSL